MARMEEVFTTMGAEIAEALFEGWSFKLDGKGGKGNGVPISKIIYFDFAEGVFYVVVQYEDEELDYSVPYDSLAEAVSIILTRGYRKYERKTF